MAASLRLPAFLSLLTLAACTGVAGKPGDSGDSGAVDTGSDTDVSGGGNGNGAIDWYTSVAELAEGGVGIQVTGTCPPRGSDGQGAVWGTGTYTDDSAVCAAAVHDGRITFDGGAFTAETRDGQSAYVGSTANGVTSEEYGEWGRSFVFLP